MTRVDARIRPEHAAFLPGFLPAWAAATTGAVHRELEASLVMFDISGFTRLTERLSMQGRAGAEELSDILHDVFTPLVHAAQAEGADLLKWGGDAVLLLVDGSDHAGRAARATWQMQRVMAQVGHLRTSVGRVVLRASSGIESGVVHLVLAGDPAVHRELMVVGPVASAVCALDSAAGAGQIVLGPGAVAALPARVVGDATGPGWRLAAPPLGVLDSEVTAHRDLAAYGGDPDLLASLLPPQLRAHLTQHGHEAEHRMVSAAFLRFDGTDRLLAEQGPDALAAAVDELVRNVQDAVTRYGVAFHESDVDVDGGKVMLLAGAPLSTGDDVEHLVAAVRLVADRAGRIPVRFGVTRGRVFAGDLGPPSRRTYSVKGAAVNLAARLASKAGPGDVLAPAELLDHCQRSYDVEVRPPLALKGLSEPVPAVAIGAARDTPRRDVTTLLHGRDTELDRLVSALDEAGTGRGAVVELVAEPGMGKTRLVAELLSAASDFTVLHTGGDRSGGSATYGTARQLLGQALGVAALKSREEAAAHVLARVASVAPALADRVPLLDAVLDLGLADSGTTADVALDEQFRAEVLQRLVVEMLAAAVPGPAVLVVEDTHLIDPASAGILDRLAATVPERPWLLLTTRRESLDGWRSPGEVVELAPLADDAARALTEAVTPDRPLPPTTVDTIVARAGGHPLFLRELALGAARGDSLEDPPESVEALVAVQLDALPPDDRALLRRAAVLGTTFDVGLLGQMLEADRGQAPGAALDVALTRLDGFVTAEGNRLAFRHAIHREVAYAGLSFRTRSSLHARAAQILEGDPGMVLHRPELLALHFFAGARYEQAWRYARRAGERAHERYAPAAAAEAFHRAAEAARRSPAVPDSERAVDLESLGDALFVCGRSEEANRAYLDAGRAALHLPAGSAALALKRAKVAQRQGRYSLALRRLTGGLSVLAESGDDGQATAFRARLLSRRAFVLTSQGRYDDARAAARQAIDAATVAGERHALAEAHLVLQLGHVFSGTPDTDQHGEQALALYVELGDLGGQAHMRNNLAMRRLLEGRWTEAATMFEEAADTFRRVGDAANAANASYNQGDLLNRQGRYAEAAHLLDGALRVARAVGDEELVGLVLREQGRALARDRRPEGLVLLADAREVLDALGEPHEVVDTDIAVAEAHLLAGRPAEALDTITEALETVRALGAPTLLPSAHRVHAAALLELGDVDAAAESLGEGLRVSQAPELAHERGFLQVVQARLLEQAVDGAARPAGTATPTVSVPLQRQARQSLESLGVRRAPLPWSVPMASEAEPGDPDD